MAEAESYSLNITSHHADGQVAGQNVCPVQNLASEPPVTLEDALEDLRALALVRGGDVASLVLHTDKGPVEVDRREGPPYPKDILDPMAFVHLAPTAAQLQMLQRVQAIYAQAAFELVNCLPAGPDKTHAIRILRDSSMWATMTIVKDATGKARPEREIAES